MSPGPELDLLIAEKVMGWTWVTEDAEEPQYLPWLISPKVGTAFRGVWYPKTGVASGLPAYSTEISAAWQVVEKLDALGFYVTVDRLGHDPRFWRAETHTWDADEGGRVGDNWHDAETAPHAICLAALAAVGVEIPA